jgi:hypothetical protein
MIGNTVNPLSNQGNPNDVVVPTPSFLDPNSLANTSHLSDDFDVKRSQSGRGSIGRAPGVTNYNPDKLQILLEIVQEFLPTNDDEWELVCQKFNQTFHVSDIEHCNTVITYFFI